MELRFGTCQVHLVPGLGTQSHCFPRPGAKDTGSHSFCMLFSLTQSPASPNSCRQRPSSVRGLSWVPILPVLSFYKTGLLVFALMCHTAGSGTVCLVAVACLTWRTMTYCLNGAPLNPSALTFPGPVHFPLSLPEWLLLARFTHHTQSTIPLSPA